MSNGDRANQKEEIEAWVNNFPVKMKISPNRCLGLRHSPSGRRDDKKEIGLFGVNFFGSSFESRGETLGPLFEGFIQKLVEKENEDKKERGD